MTHGNVSFRAARGIKLQHKGWRFRLRALVEVFLVCASATPLMNMAERASHRKAIASPEGVDVKQFGRIVTIQILYARFTYGLLARIIL